MKIELRLLSTTMIVGGIMLIFLTFRAISWYNAAFSIIFVDSTICLFGGMRQSRILGWIGAAGILISLLTLGYSIYGGSDIFPIAVGAILGFVGAILLRR